MQTTASATPAALPDKARAVRHYQALAREAARHRKPELSCITGWQSDRRRAVALLRHQETIARRAGRHDDADAFWSAAWDVNQLLRECAAAVISESCHMHFIDWQRYGYADGATA